MSELVQKILEIIGSFAGLIFGAEEFKRLKIIFMFFSLIFSLLAIVYFFYLERKYKIGTSILLTNIKNFLEGFIKPENLNQEWKKIKEIFIIDYFLALDKIYRYLQEVINFYEYEGNTLSEKYQKIPNSVFNNKNDFLRALKILELIRNQKENIDINPREALALIRVIEKGLTELLVIDSQAQWAIFLILPES